MRTMRRRPGQMPAPASSSLPLEDLERAMIIGVKSMIAELRRLSAGTTGSKELARGSPLNLVRAAYASADPKIKTGSSSFWVEWLLDQKEPKVKPISRDKAIALDLPQGCDLLFNEITIYRTLHVRIGNTVREFRFRGKALAVFLVLIFTHRGRVVSHANVGSRLPGFENLKPLVCRRRVYQYKTRLCKLLGDELASRIFGDAGEGKYHINLQGFKYGWVRLNRDADSSQFLRPYGNPSENQ